MLTHYEAVAIAAARVEAVKTTKTLSREVAAAVPMPSAGSTASASGEK